MSASPNLDDIRAQLLGAWTLARWGVDFSDGRAASFPFGADAVGLIVYSADGWMNASIARTGRSPLSAASVRQAPVAEQCAAFESYFNYAGSFLLRVINGEPHVVHAVHFSLNQNFVGSEQVRRIRFDGADRLTLSADERVGDTLRQHRLDWQRARS